MKQEHMEPLPTPLIKSKYENNSGKYFVKLKVIKDPKSATQDLYEFNMDLFDNGDPEEFLLFVQNFNINLAASGKLVTGAKIQCLCTLVRG